MSLRSWPVMVILPWASIPAMSSSARGVLAYVNDVVQPLDLAGRQRPASLITRPGSRPARSSSYAGSTRYHPWAESAPARQRQAA